MDSKQLRESLKSITEYNEAKERFKKFSKQESQDESNVYLDEVVLKLCTGEFQLEAGNEASLFFDILYHSDFLQIKNEFMGIFYSELCRTFFLSNLFDDIDRNLEQLEDISQVKIYLVQGFFKLLRVVPKYEDNYLILKYSSDDLWCNIGSEKITHLKINPCAYKVMLSNTKFNLSHLNFIFRIIEVENVILNGCNLNGRNVQHLFKGLKLKYLGLSKCGSNVNTLFQDELLELKHLSDLDISWNPLYNSTLEKIRNIPLKSLNINDSVKTIGSFVNSIWFAKNFPSQESSEVCKGDIDLLWEAGCLQETIKVLNINHDLIQQNVRKISNLNLVELNIGNLKNIELLQLDFPHTLKSLILRDVLLGFNEFAKMCTIPLEKLEFAYVELTPEIAEQMNEDFSPLNDSPLTKSLKELSIYFEEPSENLVNFISKLKLRYFKCDGELENESLDRFICDYEHRKYLESLFIHGVFIDLTPQLVNGIKKLKLREFGIGLPDSTEYHYILRLENLHETVETLTLSEQECGDRELEQIAKFKKVKTLSFSFAAGVSSTYLKQIAHMNSLESLEVEARIKGQLDLKGVLSLSAIPIRTLSVYDDYGKSITDEAFKYLSKGENFANFCKNAVILNMRVSLKPNMAIVLGRISWETINIDVCAAEKNHVKLLFQNENLKYTLQLLKFMDLELDWEDIGRLFISEMIIEQYNIPEEALKILASKPISKFLRYILFEDRNIKRNYLLNTNVSEVDTYG